MNDVLSLDLELRQLALVIKHLDLSVDNPTTDPERLYVLLNMPSENLLHTCLTNNLSSELLHAALSQITLKVDPNLEIVLENEPDASLSVDLHTEQLSETDYWRTSGIILYYLGTPRTILKHVCRGLPQHQALPYLLDLLERIQDLSTLWDKLWELVPHDPLVLTTILCAIWDEWKVTKVPHAHGKQPYAVPQSQDRVWELWKTCLKSDNDLLHKRALFMMSSLDDNQWQQYVNIGQVITMEVETHLIEQIWKPFSKLTVSWEWKQLLLNLALFHRTTSIRKLSLFRVLKGEAGIAHTEMPSDFVFELILCLDQLMASGLGVEMIQKVGKKQTGENMMFLLNSLVDTHLRQTNHASDLFERIWNVTVAPVLRPRTMVNMMETIASTLRDSSTTVEISQEFAIQIPITWDRMNAKGSIVKVYKTRIELALATILGCAEPVKYSPASILNILKIFPIDGDPAVSESLEVWITKTCLSKGDAGTLATAFVDGMLANDWDRQSGCSKRERSLARAIVKLNQLLVQSGEQLWPAIHKGLGNTQTALFTWEKADRVSRALSLLDFGCRLRVISGMGNGELVVDRSQNMMPPPSSIENLLVFAVRFTVHHLRYLTTFTGDDETVDAVEVSLACAILADQLHVISKGFLSSIEFSSEIEHFLGDSTTALSSGTTTTDDAVMNVSLLYTMLHSGGTLNQSTSLSVAKAIVHLRFDESATASRKTRAMRSLYQYSKWEALSKLLKFLCQTTLDSEAANFVCDLFDDAIESVKSVSLDTHVPLFNCLSELATARFEGKSRHHIAVKPGDITKLVEAVYTLYEHAPTGADSTYMLDEMCALMFRPALLLEEYYRLKEGRGDESPIRDIFRRLIANASTHRPHVTRIVLSRMAAAWLSPVGDVCEDIGRSSIAYREDIAAFLLRKEENVALEGLSYQKEVSGENARLQLAKGTDNTSISRGFVLVYLSKLPDLDKLSKPVLDELIQYLIDEFLEIVVLQDESILYAASEYSTKARALQALCVLSRFVAPETASYVGKKVFEGMGMQNPHNQLRYFLENLTVLLSLRHPIVFSKLLVENIHRTDLPLATGASLMIISGNLVVGRYASEFCSKLGEKELNLFLEDILAGVIPWLSSSQGFSRAIAQLLAYKLIPIVLDTTASNADNKVIRSIFKLLDENAPMIHVRKKQTKYFEHYDISDMDKPEGVLRTVIDNGKAAVEPLHMVDILKESLREIYAEAHVGADVPLWKKVEQEREAEEAEARAKRSAQDGSTNFQRKIIPLDALNLALETVKEQRRRNVAGRTKQELIVCASLIDKVPNLGGLARTSEIFAAERLVVPDRNVLNSGEFKSLSVTANDWIEVEECREKDLLRWLRKRKEEGYLVVGLEQTSSSLSLSKYTFPEQPTVLLLGKEKEGIPAQYLHVVDQCLEIPQLGIIRSLNVHVSGAIAIWEFTKQRLEANTD